MSRVWILIAAGIVGWCIGCAGGTAGGGGGSFGSGGQAGAPCAAATQNQGCLGATGQQMVCDPASGQWQLANVCPADTYCAEASDPAAPGTAKKVTSCKAKIAPDVAASGGTDAATASADADADVTGASDSKPTDQADTLADGSGDTGAKLDGQGKDACVPACSGKACGPDGCGGFCGNCPSNKPICIDGECISDCTPACAGKKCGPDGCGGQCGSCAGSSACQSGQCVPVSAGLAVGEQCYGMAEQCEAGSDCVPSMTATGSECMANQPTGQPCGPMIGYCEPGSTCKYTSKDKAAMKCYADGGVGATCNPYGAGDCTNALCQWTNSAATLAKCYALGAAGAACGGVGKGGCKPGLACIAPDATATSGSCMPEIPIGGECGYGIGSCAEPGGCFWASASKLKATCLAPGKPGEACATWGKSNQCVPWYSCVADTATSGSASHCKPMKTIGTTCGYGLGFCLNGLDCMPNDASGKSYSCRPGGPKGATCALGKSGCIDGYTCNWDSSGVSGTCADLCELKKYYGDGECDAYCVDPDPDCFQLGGG